MTGRAGYELRPPPSQLLRRKAQLGLYQQLVAVLGEPAAALLPVGQDALDDPPEGGGVVRLAQVGQLVDHDVIDDAGRQQDALPVEVQATALAARAPAEAELLDRDGPVGSTRARPAY